MTTAAAILLALVAVALGYAAGRADRIDLGPLRWRIGRRPFFEPDPGASAAELRRRRSRGATDLRPGNGPGARQREPLPGRSPVRNLREGD
jgi:hypothetical protein